MLNQLAASSDRYKRLNKPNIYNQFLRRSQEIEADQSYFAERGHSFLRGKQQKIYKKLLSNSLDELDKGNLSTLIKQRLRSKRVELPEDLPSAPYPYIEEDIQANFMKNSKHDELKKGRKKRFKTYQDSPLEDSEEQQAHQTLNQIRELNNIFFKNSNRKAIKLSNISYESPQRRRFNHISRQQDFEKYVSHLERQHGQQPVERQRNIEISPINYRKFPEITTRKEEVVKPVINSPPSSSLEYKKSDNFIKILQKVKARGESLLVKLSKFPSYRHLSK